MLGTDNTVYAWLVDFYYKHSYVTLVTQRQGKTACPVAIWLQIQHASMSWHVFFFLKQNSDLLSAPVSGSAQQCQHFKCNCKM